MAILNSFPSSGSKDISSATVTLVNSSFTYDGQVKVQHISSVTLGGNTLTLGENYIVTGDTAVTGGTHTLKIIGIGEYSGEKDVSWTIAKVQGSVSVDESSITVYGVAGITYEIVPTVIGDGALSAVSNDTDIVTASVNNGVVTLTIVNEGNATITITLQDGINYYGSSCAVEIETVVFPELSEATPAQIKSVAELGVGNLIWSIGDITAPISIAAFSTIAATSACAFIIGFDHNLDVEGTGIHFQFGKTTDNKTIAFVDSNYGQDLSNGTIGIKMYSYNQQDNFGWSVSYMRNTICSQFLSALPSAWQNIIAQTTKRTCEKQSGTATVVESSDKIFLLAEYEMIDHTKYSSYSYGGNISGGGDRRIVQQYQYYKNGNSRIAYKHNAKNTACNWWTRSYNDGNRDWFVITSSGGGSDIKGGYYSLGFAPAFRVA